MAVPGAVPASRLSAGDFLGSIDPDHMVYFLCNVGDADAQLILLPATPVDPDEPDDPDNPPNRRRQAIIVDAGKTKKLPRLLDRLVDEKLLPADGPEAGQEHPVPDGSIPLVIATHPHADHVGGIPELLTGYKHRISEFWDSGYYFTSAKYHKIMNAVEAHPHLMYAQPTSGFRRWIGSAAVTVMSPSIHLRNRFDTYGVDPNNASVSVRIEFPAARVIQRTEDRELVDEANTMSLLLGADAQTLSWSFVMTDFPELHPSDSAAAKAIDAATGEDLVSADILKVSHHGSKHGVNLELVERISPQLMLVSSVAGAGRYKFPHTVAQDLIREAMDPTTTSGAEHRKDWELGMFYTSDTDDAGTALGSIALVMSKGKWTMWRFGDEPGDPIDLGSGRQWQRP